MTTLKPATLSLINRRVGLGCLLISVLVATVFAAYTEHVWEDYYITYRSSLNLASGNGLVFNIGEKVHTFTSPLGVLLPALSAWVSGTQSDLTALWIFRVMSILALAVAVLLLVDIGRNWNFPTGALAVAGIWLGTDGKVVDFAINGMETAFLLLFIIYALWAHTKGPSHWRHQGVAWAGMMWTRPDCFIYVALIALGVLLFGNGIKRDATKVLLVSWLKAGAITTALYLPWILWAWSYYGTAVPHTIAAKSGLSDPFSLVVFLKTAVLLPFSAMGFNNSMGFAFLPAYCEIGGWNDQTVLIGKVLGGIAGIVWVLPFVSARTRLASFVFFGVHLYLSYFPYYYFPWYLPAATPFGILAIISLGVDGWKLRSTSPQWLRLSLGSIAVAVVLGNGLLTLSIARQMQVQQDLVENGVRRKIGEYLHQHAPPTDSVFTEPLGYIGYFSGLRTYDFPGMSSPEMVAARKLFGSDWLTLIGYLRPDWVVLRPRELQRIQQDRNWFLPNCYELVTVFDQLEAVEAQNVAGKDYLIHDAVFQLYRRSKQIEQVAVGMTSVSDFGVSEREDHGWQIISAHAEAEVLFEIPPGSRRLTLVFGFGDGAERSEFPTDGARFGFEIRDGLRIIPLEKRELEPVYREADRTRQEFRTELPNDLSHHAVLRVGIQCRQNTYSDWTYVSRPKFDLTAE